MTAMRESTTALSTTLKRAAGRPGSSTTISSSGFSAARNLKCVSRWPEITAVPGAPGTGVPEAWPGANASVRPLTPSSTIRSTPWAGTRSRATGQVSAHGHGLASRSPSSVRAHARCSRYCASCALA